MKLSINGRFLQQDVTGVQRVAIEFVRALDELITNSELAHLEVTLWVPGSGALTSSLELNSIKMCRKGTLRGHAWEQFQLPRLARGSALLCLGNTAPVMRFIFRHNPTYTMVHDLSHKYYPSAYSRSFRLYYEIVIPLVLARSEHVFTVSNSELESILRRYPRFADSHRLSSVQNGGGETLEHAPNSFTREQEFEQTETPALAREPRTCLYVGSLTKRKNAQGLMDAAVKLAEHNGVNFIFVGGTPSIFEDLSQHRARNHPDITWIGQLNDPVQIDDLYRRASVFVFPSFYEASPLPPIEAMRNGTPVVCSDIASLRERCGDAAVYCDPNDVESIVEGVSRLLNDKELWQDQQRKGFEHVKRYTWKNQARKMLAQIGAP